MSRQHCVVFLVVILLIWLCSCDEILHRQKRFLYFPFGGTFKLVLGFAIPIKLGLKQSMACGWNFQFQYPLPATTNDTRIYPPVVGMSRKKREGVSDRALAYAGFEAVLESHGVAGRPCLLRSICESAMYGLHHEANGLYGQLLHIALTPDYGEASPDPGLDPVYLEAKKAGEFGVDCSSLYPECPGDSLLDMISLLDE